MRAVVARGPGVFAVEEVPEPVVPPGGRLVHVEAAGVCAADRKLYTGDHPWAHLGLELAGTFAERLALLSDVDHDAVVTATRSLEELETALRPAWAPRVKEVLVP